MARRRRGRLRMSGWEIPVLVGVAVWALAGWSRFGAAAGMLTATAAAWPDWFARLFRSTPARGRPARSRRDSIAAAAAVGAAAGWWLGGFAGAAVGAVVAVVVYLAAAAGLRPRSGGAIRRGSQALRSRRPVRGNHHGRDRVIEEDPDGRVGVGRKRGGTGPTVIVLCVSQADRGKVLDAARRRYCHATWRVTRDGTPCPRNDRKVHIQLSARAAARRTN